MNRAGSVPVDDIKGDDTRGNSEWRDCPEIYPTAVAAFVAGYVLDIRDRHTGNVVVSEGKNFANIDFGNHPQIRCGLCCSILRSCFKSIGI